VAVLDVSARVLDGAREALAAHGEAVHFVTASVADREQMEAAAGAILGRWGRIDILVNNAAINRMGGALDQPAADWDAVIAVNLTGAFIATAVCGRSMREGGWGAIVNIGSIGAAGFGGSPAYAASKAGLLGLTRQAARELGPSNITVNYVAPGVIRTEWVEKNLGEQSMEASAANTPLRRVGAPEDIAGTVAYLTSDDARHVTGQLISVSGGVWMP
jgi:3-oxoacyl-[acyl-carrier protein] reductase